MGISLDAAGGRRWRKRDGAEFDKAEAEPAKAGHAD
jgi:hypothetical protein